jgi:hypothetical protein
VTVKTAIKICFLLLCLGLGGFSLYQFATSSELTTREATNLSIFLAIASIVASWIVADYYAIESRTKEIDMIARNSSEIILAQTVTLWELEADISRERLEHGDQITEREYDAVLRSIAHRIRSARRINNTQKTAWEGLASKATTKELKGLINTSAELYDLLDELRRREQEEPDDHQPDPAIDTLRNEIEALRARLPSSIAPPVSKAPESVTGVLGEVEFNISEASPTSLTGKASLHMNRANYNLTVTHRGPVPSEFIGRTSVECLVEVSPAGSPSIEALAKVDSTQRRLNLHLRSTTKGQPLPMGDYVIAFRFS